MPALQAVSRQVKGRIAFLGIDHQDDRSDALKFLRHTGVQYPVAFDPDGKTAAAYALFGIPTTIFINANGREVGRHLGELTEHDLESTLARLFPNR